MLTVFIPPNFIPERSYIIRTLLNHYCGIDTEIVPRKGQLHYTLTWPNKSIEIRDDFFGHTFVGESYLSVDRIPQKVFQTTMAPFESIIGFFGEEIIETTSDKIVSGIDLFAGAFFMLTRWEESLGQHEDLHGRFPAERALIVNEGHILRPVVDEYVSLLRSWLNQLGYPVPHDRSKYKVVPTCDVDIPYYWSRSHVWKVLLTGLLKHKSLKKLKEEKQTISNTGSGKEKDPYDTFDDMMSLAEKNNLRFRFHMIGGGETKFERFYTISDPRIISLMTSFIARGHEIGLHPSYNAFHNLRMIEQERANVTEYSGQKIFTSRQHYLRFTVPDTWQLLSTAFIKEDSTLGYAAEPGFRCGTSKPFPVFDIHQQKELPIIERPLLIMDVSLRMYKGFSVEESIRYCRQIIDQVKKHNGELVFLWHNSSLSDLEGWTGWQRVLNYIMTSNQ
ncbi:MAG: polysaccharide deacetylase family protein [Bacteroidota bacterium]|nr:polysaccharide deacetylase family protein [Bacteroidota bacterium]